VARLLQRLPQLREMVLADHPILAENAKDPDLDADGSATSMYWRDLRFLAVADFILDGAVAQFRSRLSQAADLVIGLFDRFDRGQLVSPSYVSMLAYQQLFDALASGRGDLSQELAERLGGRFEIEAEHDNAFTIAFGYALKHVVANRYDDAADWIEKLKLETKREGCQNFGGYADALRGIIEGDDKRFAEGQAEAVRGHKAMSTGRGNFVDTEDQLLSIWGVGLANLATSRGIKWSCQDPLIPAPLVTGLQAP